MLIAWRRFAQSNEIRRAVSVTVGAYASYHCRTRVTSQYNEHAAAVQDDAVPAEIRRSSGLHI